MTFKQATSIKKFVNELSTLALNSFAIKLARAGKSDSMTKEQGDQMLLQHQMNLQGHLVDMMENNEEQAEALMRDLGLTWNKSP